VELRVRRYGPLGRTAVVLHGGPGAPGSASELARALADPLHVLEPWQRWSSGIPLTVDRHVEDLAAVISEHIPDEKPALAGESWGAMLGLVFASRHPDRVSELALIGCGTFDRRARARLQETLAQRTGPELNAQLADLESRFPDEGERLAQVHRLSDPLYTYCRAADAEDPIEHFDAKGHVETWDDIVRLQDSGVYPAGFASITCPVLMLHGTYDPHPGPMIRDSLAAHIPQLEYHELEKCGHSPWVEAHAREHFLARLRSWLEQNLLS
jgi:pimeloyl-ACP methyl ester carboxylesterase